MMMYIVDAVPNYILEKAKTMGLFPISPSSESSPIRIDALFGLDWLFQHILSPVSERKFIDLGDGFEAYETKKKSYSLIFFFFFI